MTYQSTNNWRSSFFYHKFHHLSYSQSLLQNNKTPALTDWKLINSGWEWSLPAKRWYQGMSAWPIFRVLLVRWMRQKRPFFVMQCMILVIVCICGWHVRSYRVLNLETNLIGFGNHKVLMLVDCSTIDWLKSLVVLYKGERARLNRAVFEWLCQVHTQLIC